MLYAIDEFARECIAILLNPRLGSADTSMALL
jgi:hypothetical protein